MCSFTYYSLSFCWGCQFVWCPGSDLHVFRYPKLEVAETRHIYIYIYIYSSHRPRTALHPVRGIGMMLSFLIVCSHVLSPIFRINWNLFATNLRLFESSHHQIFELVPHLLINTFYTYFFRRKFSYCSASFIFIVCSVNPN